MNLGEIREAVFAQADWAPTQSEDAKERLNDFINRAHNQIALEAPFLFFDSEVRFATQPDVVGSSADTIQVVEQADTSPSTSRNAWVMQRDAAVGAGGFDAWPVDRSWDGRVIEIVESNGTVHRNRIRTIWKQEVPGGKAEYWLSLWTPWDLDRYGYGPFTYRIYSDLYYLPDDLIEFRSARLWKASYNWPLTVLGQDEAEQRSIADRRTELAAGQPRALFRRQHFQLPGPKVPPSLTLTDPLAGGVPLWKGPEPIGKFDYVITYTWGKRDADFRNATLGYWAGNALPWEDEGIAADAVAPSKDRFREPLWESAPSPVSATVEITGDDVKDNARIPAIELTLPNIEYMQGFMMKGTRAGAGFIRRNYARSGWHVRIYRRRYTEDYAAYTNNSDGGFDGIGSAIGGGQVIDSLHKLDLSSKYYLIAEVRIDDINEGKWYDDGTFLPDYHRPLRDIHGYQSIQLYPKPDERYEVDIRCLRRPETLVDDTDVPRIHSEAMDVLVHKTLVLLYEHQGQMELAQLAKLRYTENLDFLKKRYAEQRPAQTPVSRRLARARVGLGRGGIRRWYSTDT